MKLAPFSTLLMTLAVSSVSGVRGFRVSCASDDPTPTPTMAPTTPPPTTATPEPTPSTPVPTTSAPSTPVPTTPAPTKPVPIGPHVRFTSLLTASTVDVVPALSVCYDLTCLEGGSYANTKAAWEVFPEEETSINFFKNANCAPDDRVAPLPATEPISLSVGPDGFLSFSITVGAPLPSTYAAYESACPAPAIL